MSNLNRSLSLYHLNSYGRKKSLFILTGLHGLTQIAVSFSPNVIVFMILRAVTAAFTRATYSIGYTLCK